VNVFRPPGSSTLPRFRPVNTRKRVRVVAIVLASCTALGVGAWVWGVDPNEDFTTECQRDDYVAPVPDPVTVNVYNGTQTIGLGATVADALRQRGFTIGEIKNDPLGRKIRGTGEVRTGEGTDTTNIVDALRSWQPGMVVTKERTTKAHEVDFVLGAKFEALKDKAEPPPGTPKGACKPGTGNNTSGDKSTEN
jgi:hypothetical protein